MESKVFYRIGNIITNDGLWYNQAGDFTGLIYKQFDFLQASQLEMPKDDRVVGYLSATESMEELHRWFPKEELARLRDNNYHLYKYLATDYKFYPLYNHMVINQLTSQIIEKLD